MATDSNTLDAVLSGKFFALDQRGDGRYRVGVVKTVVMVSDRPFLIAKSGGETTLESLSSSIIFFDNEASAEKEATTLNAETGEEGEAA
jgi:hypothetical protein